MVVNGSWNLPTCNLIWESLFDNFVFHQADRLWQDECSWWMRLWHDKFYSQPNSVKVFSLVLFSARTNVQCSTKPTHEKFFLCVEHMSSLSHSRSHSHTDIEFPKQFHTSSKYLMDTYFTYIHKKRKCAKMFMNIKIRETHISLLFICSLFVLLFCSSSSSAVQFFWSFIMLRSNVHNYSH